jgi:hypothetical protein
MPFCLCTGNMIMTLRLNIVYIIDLLLGGVVFPKPVGTGEGHINNRYLLFLWGRPEGSNRQINPTAGGL